MLKPLSILSLLLLFLARSLVAQAPSSSKPTTSNSKADHSEEAFVIEQFSRKERFENDGTSSSEDTARVQIQSEAGVQQLAKLLIRITVVPRAGGLVWLDTTTEVGPYQYLVSPLRDKHALAIWKDKPAALVNTPADKHTLLAALLATDEPFHFSSAALVLSTASAGRREYEPNYIEHAEESAGKLEPGSHAAGKRGARRDRKA
jgi:hypothetical protein